MIGKSILGQMWKDKIYKNYIYIFFLEHTKPKCGEKNHTPVKLLDDSSMTHKWNEDIMYQVSQLEKKSKGLEDSPVKHVDLGNA